MKFKFVHRLCTALYRGDVQRYTEAMYSAIQRRCTALYRGNVQRYTEAMNKKATGYCL